MEEVVSQKRIDKAILTGEKYKSYFNFWTEKIDSAEAFLLSGNKRNVHGNYNRDYTEILLDKKLFSILSELVKGNDLGVFVLLVAGFKILLNKYSGKEEITIKSSLYNLNIYDMRFAEEVLLMQKVSGSDTVKEFLIKLKQTVSETYKFQDFPLNAIADDFAVRTFSNIKIRHKSLHSEDEFDTNEDFFVELENFNDTIKIGLRFNSNICDKEFADSMLMHYARVLSHFENLDILVKNIDILSEEERTLINSYNQTVAFYPKEKPISVLFEETVLENNDSIALVFGKYSLTYNELNKRANKLANYLRVNYSIGPDNLVGVLLDRTEHSIISLLGILKAGGAYLPIDPGFPKERVNLILGDAKPKLVVTQSSFMEILDTAELPLFISDLQLDMLDDSEENPLVVNKSSDLAYVLYTSGSTGVPKGVLIEQKSVVRLVKNTNFIDICNEDKILQGGSLSFDASTFEIWGALLNGASLHLVDKNQLLDIKRLKEVFENDQITISWFTSSYFNELADHHPDLFGKLKKLLVGGDRLSAYHINKVKAAYPALHIINGYGPTENTTFTACHLITEYYSYDIPIGRPIANTQVYILNQYLQLNPVGVIGEIYTSGDGLARGYLNREDITKERFIDNPFKQGEHIYKTGDLGRWRYDGNIDFIGRNDDQVKLRGFRIELEEIAHAIRKHPAVKEVFIDIQEFTGKEKQLVAYFVGDQELASLDLKTFLATSLPEFMLPEYFVKLNKFPLTINGKIDKSLLPNPLQVVLGKEHIVPRNETEQKLEEIWKEILGLNKISVDDNFFDLGGHSLKATNLIARIHQVLKVEVPLNELFSNPTIEAIANYIDLAENSMESILITSAPKAECYPLSSAQKRIYLLCEMEKTAITYNVPFFMFIDGQLDVQRFSDAFETIVQRHDSLRSRFEMINGTPFQRIKEKLDFNIEIIQASEDKLEEFIDNFIRPFDLSKDNLLRISLLKFSETRYMMMFDIHHIISDGVSTGIIVKEFVCLYEGKSLEKNTIQYKDFAVWHNEWIYSEKVRKQEAFWLNKFKDEMPVLNLSTDFSRPAFQSFEGDSIRFELNKKETEDLNEFCRKQEVTPYILLLTSLNILLSKYAGQDDLVIGSPIAARPHPDLQQVLGVFVNTLAMRNKPEPEKAFLLFLNEVKANALEAYENQDYPFEQLVEKVITKRDVSRSAIFDVMFVFQNADMGDLQIKDLSFIPYPVANKTTKFDLLFGASETQCGELTFVIEFCTALFRKSTIERMSGHFLQVLRQVILCPSLSIKEIILLTEAERNEIAEFSGTKPFSVKGNLLHELIEMQVEKSPDIIALSYAKEELTYRELDEKANKLAGLLKEEGVSSGVIVGLLLQRSLEMVIAMQAVLKAGGAYLPIDPAYPRERIDFMLKDSNTRLLLVDNFKEVPSDASVKIINIKEDAIYKRPLRKLDHNESSSDLAYVIYTSGSTGQPKGVAIEHRNAVSFINSCNEEFKRSDYNVIFAATSYSFDLSIFEIFFGLQTGKQVRILDSAVDISKNLSTENGILLNTVPSVITELVDMQADLSNVKVINMAGETIPEKVKHALSFDSLEVRNLYGPSECTTYSSCYRFSKYLEGNNIGRPLSNTMAFILDKYNNPVPIGIPGELCLSGAGVGRGYLYREELTAEKFIKATSLGSEKIYKTGDLAKWNQDGTIEFLGRFDHQVKIRGYRIELGEIENRLLEAKNIEQALVLDKTDSTGSRYLCAYVVGNKGEVDLQYLKDHLAFTLPSYMIPSHLIPMEVFPYTSNGKIDRKSLPDPHESRENNFVTPSNETEIKLSVIWQELLGVNTIGANDNFFDLGGHSLKATVLMSRIHKQFGLEIPLKMIFRFPVLKDLAGFIITQSNGAFSSITPATVKEYYPLSAAQKRLYIIDQLEGAALAYNMPLVLQVEGSLKIEKLEKAFKVLTERHESLRTFFEIHHGEPVQRIHDKVDFKISYSVAEEEWAEREIKNFIKPFDLFNAPLMRLHILNISESKNYLLFDMHHIISDGVSLSLLVKDFVDLYQNKTLDPVNIQYKDYAEWQLKTFESPGFAKAANFWKGQFSDEIPVLHLPLDYSRPAVRSFKGAQFEFALDHSISKKLKKFASQSNTTVFTVLLSIYNILLSRYSNQDDIVVGTPLSGRNHFDLEPVIGMFVNTLALRNKPLADKTFMQFLEEVKENFLCAFENQQYPVEQLVDELKVARDMSRSPLFDVMFSYQNKDEYDIKIPGLKFSQKSFVSEVSKFDMTLNVINDEDRICFSLEYCSELFSEKTMKRFASHLENIVQQVLKNPAISLSAIDMLRPEEKQQLIADFNNTDVYYPKDQTVLNLWNKQVSLTPDNIALVCDDEKLSYKELDEKSENLASLLQKGENKIGIMLDRSVDMIVAIIAVLKSGGVYVPIDIDYPFERIKYLLNDSSAEVLITQSEYVGKFGFNGNTICLDKGISGKKKLRVKTEVKPSQLAYIIYTSGSTGNPKGVMVSHASLYDYINTFINKFSLTSSDAVLHQTSISFDTSVEAIFPILCVGGKLVINKYNRDLSNISSLLKENQVTLLSTTPLVIDYINSNLSDLFNLRLLLSGGEVLKPIYINSLIHKVEIYNGYGPCESTVCTTFHKVISLEENIPIGKPIANRQVYVTNDFNNLQPIAVVGELCIGGQGLAIGYLNQDQLTEEKFVDNPFVPGTKMYKTGDLVRWLPDGVLEFIGRKDNQVKIRGFRIELGEIEKVLLRHHGIREALVLSMEIHANELSIVAYVVVAKGLSVPDIIAYVENLLPNYMVPSYFVIIDKLPLTTNGKIERKALPKPNPEDNRNTEFVEATTDIQKNLTVIWMKILDISKVGIHDNFFQLGGNSLKIIKLLKLIDDLYPDVVKVNDLFDMATIAQLAATINERLNSNEVIENQVPVKPKRVKF